MQTIKSMIIRLFPTKDQEQKMWQHIGASRFIWNYMLALQQERYKNGEKHLSAYGMNYVLTDVKHSDGYEWLNDISCSTLQRTCADLAKAYDGFFKKQTGFPKFKSRKKSKPSFALADAVGKVWFSETCVNVPTVGKVAYKTNYEVPLGNKIKFMNPRIQYTANHKWIITVGVDCESQAPILTDKPMGIDLGVKELAVVAFGDEQIVFHNKNKSKKVRQLRRKLKHLQRNLARKYRTNGSYEETNAIKELKDRIKRLYFHISNIQKDYIHQTTHALISLLPKMVTMEELNVKGMMRNHCQARSIQEQCFSEFIRQMKYKCEWDGIEFFQVDRFYPSSKTCSCCGAIKKDLKQGDRIYICKECGAVIDRDYNAAINLMKYKIH